MYRMPHSSRFRQPHPSKRNKKLGQTYCPKSCCCRGTKHGLTPGSKQHCKLRMRADADAGAETPLESHSQKGRTMRYDTTSLLHRASSSSSTAQRNIQPFADFRFYAAMVHLSLDLGHSRFKAKPDCVLCQQTHICAEALLPWFSAHCRLQSGVWWVRVRTSAMGFNALADLAATCVAAGCGRSGGSCWAAYVCMHAGWLAGRRALGEFGQSGRLFIQHPVAAFLVAV